MDDVNQQICTIKWPSGTIYQGHVKNGKMHGSGTLTFANGNKYIGDFVAGNLIVISKNNYFCFVSENFFILNFKQCIGIYLSQRNYFLSSFSK
jgi:hypothetical protein